MSTNDVPGANPANRDMLAGGAWAEHDDGSLIYVYSVEGGRVVYTMFDIGVDPPVEYRDAMPEKGFKVQFTWKPDDEASIPWTWHDKTPFPWDRIMGEFPTGPRSSSAVAVQTAASRVAESLKLRAQAIERRHVQYPTPHGVARSIMSRLGNAFAVLTGSDD